jgi:hypothetical protein
MKNHGLFIILAFMLSISIPLNGQFVNNAVDDVYFHEVVAQGGGTHTGDVQLFFPLLSVPGRNGLDYPLVLTYRSGIAKHQRSSWVGLGFNLEVGKVTRAVVNRVDEQHEDMFDELGEFNIDGRLAGSGVGEGNDYSEASGLLMNTFGKEGWDRYNVHLSTESIEIVPIYDSEASTYIFRSKTWRPWHFTFNYPFYETGLAPNRIRSGHFIENFSVKDDNGVTYDFKEVHSIEIDNHRSGNDRTHMKYPVSWKISQITGPNYSEVIREFDGVIEEPDHIANDNDVGEWIRFEYDNYAHGDHGNTRLDASILDNTVVGIHKMGKSARGGNTPIGDFNTNLYYDYSYIKKIITPTHEAIFETSPREDYVGLNGVKAKQLDAIVLTNRLTGDVVKRIEFVYATSPNNLDDDWDANEMLKDNQLTLLAIKQFNTTGERALPPHTFTYYGNDYHDGTSAYDYANWGYSSNGPQWSLKEVKYPEGGSALYEYEEKRYKWYNKTNYEKGILFEYIISYNADEFYEGGHRLKAKNESDGMGNVYRFEYEYGDGVKTYPSFHASEQWFANAIGKNRGFIGYRDIKTILPNNNGYSIEYFTTLISEDFVTESTSGPDRLPESVECRADIFELTDPTNILGLFHDKSFARGLIWKSETYNQNGELIAESRSAINTEDAVFIGNDPAPSLDSDEIWRYKPASWWLYQTQTLEMLDGVTMRTDYEYNNTNGAVNKTTEFNNDGSKRIKTTRFAFEVEPYFSEHLNNLKAPYEEVIYKDDVAPGNAVKASRTIWENYNPNDDGRKIFRPAKQLVWNESGATKSFDGDSEDQWQIVSQNHVYDLNGKLIESSNANNVSTSFTFAANGAINTAKFIGSSNDVSLFEDFSYGNYYLTDNDEIIIGTAGLPETESNQYWQLQNTDLDGNNQYQWQIYNGTLHSNANYPKSFISLFDQIPEAAIVEFDMKINYSQNVNPEGFGGLHFKKGSKTSDNESQNDFGYYLKINNNGRAYFVYPDGGDPDIGPFFTAGHETGYHYEDYTWHHVRLEMNNSQFTIFINGSRAFNTIDDDLYLGNYIGFVSSNAEVQFDNVRIYAPNAHSYSAGYDPTGFTMNEVQGIGGETVKYEYDKFNRLSRIYNADHKLTELRSYYFAENNTGIRSDNPNFVRRTILGSEDGFLNFYHGLSSDVVNSSGKWELHGVNSAFLLSEGNQDNIGYMTGDSYIKTNLDEKNNLIKVDFYPDRAAANEDEIAVINLHSSSSEFIVVYNAQDERFSVKTKTHGYQNPIVVFSHFNAPPEQWYTVEIDKNQSGYCTAYVYKRNDSRDYNTSYLRGGFPPNNWQPEMLISAGNRRNRFFINNIYAGNIQETTTYFDGFGRKIQTQNRIGSDAVIKRHELNFAGEVVKDFYPVIYRNHNNRYLSPNFLSEHLDLLAAEITYSKDPLQRKTKLTHPMSELYGEINFEYGSETLFGHPHRYYKTTKEDGLVTMEYVDNLEIFTYNIRPDLTAHALVGDYTGNVIENRPPNYYNSPQGIAENWLSYYRYRTNGLLEEEESPDQGVIKHVYNTAGLLRFTQNSDQATSKTYSVRIYDQFDRLILVGEEKDVLWTTSPPDETDLTLGTDADEWKVKYIYDEHTSGKKENWIWGRLSRVELNADIDMEAENLQTFIYDNTGSIISKIMETEKNVIDDDVANDGPGNALKKELNYVYDHLGREIVITYPSKRVAIKTYDELNQLKTIVTNPEGE